MKKGLAIFLIILGVIALIGLIYYFFIYKNEKARLSTESASNLNTNNNTPQTPSFSTGEIVYLKPDAPSAGSEYTSDETVIYSAPYATPQGTYVIGKLNRSWYGNQPIGTVVSDSGNWVKVKVGMLSDFRYYPFVVGSGYGNTAPVNIYSGKGSRDVYFGKQYLTNVQY